MKRKLLMSTVELARAARVPLSSLQFWINSGKIAAPPVRLIGGKAVRHWTEADVERIRKMKGALKRGPKGPRKRARRAKI